MAMGEEVGDAYISVHADTTPFRRDLARLGKQTAVPTKAVKELTEGLSRLETQAKKSGNVVDKNYTKRMREAAQRTVKTRNATSDLRAEFTKMLRTSKSIGDSDFTAKMESRLKTLEKVTRDYNVEIAGLSKGSEEWRQANIRLNKSLAGLGLTMGKDKAVLDERMKSWREMSEVQERAIRDNKEFDAATKKSRENIDKNTESHRRWGRSMDSSTKKQGILTKALGKASGAWRRMDRTVRAVVLAITFAGNFVSALSSGLSAGAVAIAAAASAALVGLLPILGVLAPLALGLAAAVAGFKDLEKFAPKASVALEGLKKQFSGVAVPSLMKEWGASLAEFFNSLKGFLTGDIFTSIGRAFATITASLTAVLSSDVGKNFQAAIAGPLSSALATVGSALGPILSTVLQFLTASAPFAQKLADLFLAWSVNLQAAFSGQVADGSFAVFMDKAVTALTTLLGLIGNIGDVIRIVFTAGTGPGTEFLQLLSDLVGQFETWLQSFEGQAALAQFFNGIMVILPPLLDLIGAIGKGLADLVTPEIMAQAAGLLTALADIVPVLSDIINIIGAAGILDIFTAAIGAIGEVIKPLIGPAQEFLSIFSDTLIGVLKDISPVLGMVGAMFGKLLTALAPLLPILGNLLTTMISTLVPIILQLADAFIPLLDMVLPLLVPLIASLVPALGQIVGAVMKVVSALLPFVGILLEALLPILSPIIDFIGVLADIIADVLLAALKVIIPILEPFVAILGILTPILELLTPVLELVGVLIDVLLTVILAILQPLLDLITETEHITQAIEIFSEWIAVAVDWINEIIDVIRDWIENLDLGKWAEDAWNSIKSAFETAMNWFDGWKNTVIGFFDNIQAGIQNAFKSAFNYVADAWNKTVGKLSWTIPDWVPGIGGNTIKAPTIPKYAAGGVFDKATLGVFGEAGSEALVPLNRPLSQVDPSVRALSAFAQGLGGGTNISEGAIVIHTGATDGGVIAASVLDRLVTYAR